MTRLGALLAGLVLSLFAASPAAGAIRTEYFGIVQGAALDTRDIRGMAAARVRTDRFMIAWKGVEPRPGSFNWARTDRLVGELAAHGIRPFPFLWGSPPWVTSGPAKPPVDSAFDQQAWRTFLNAVVARYGPGGTYWANLYHQQFGAAAKPLPVQFWQIWNEPNLRKYFAPTGGGAQKYAQLLQISHNVIKGRNPNARIVLAGMLGSGDQTAWYFLRSLYGVAGFRANFDVAALHPYASTLGQFRDEIVRVRGVMANRGDAAKPLWLSEFGWGSAPPDRYGINKGLYGQRKMLVDSFNRVLDNRRAWNVQRIYWFIWRDPKPGSPQATLCSFCGSGGLLTYGRAAKPAYSAFRSFTAETNPPTAAITGGPAQGGFTRDSTPTFTFSSSEHGSTFACRFGAQPFSPCSSPFTSRLPDGARTFAVHAIDAPGNQSAAVSRSFTVDTRPPAAPQITDTDPDSPANINTLRVKGSAEPASRVRLYKTAGCAGAPLAQGWAGQFAAPGIAVTVADNTATAFRATATDRAGNTSACSAPLYYVERSTP